MSKKGKGKKSSKTVNMGDLLGKFKSSNAGNSSNSKLGAKFAAPCSQSVQILGSNATTKGGMIRPDDKEAAFAALFDGATVTQTAGENVLPLVKTNRAGSEFLACGICGHACSPDGAGVAAIRVGDGAERVVHEKCITGKLDNIASILGVEFKLTKETEES